MKKRNRLLSFIAALMLMMNLLPIAGAGGVVYSNPMERPQFLAAGSDEGMFSAAMRADLSRQFSNCKKTVDLSAYRLSYTTAICDALADFIYYEMTEAFHVIEMAVGYNSSTGKIANLVVTYACTAKEYADYLAECKAAADALLAGIEGNSSLGEVEKALLLHDRLILQCEYEHEINDTELLEAFSMYGALVEGSAVCQGYTAAYDYLLERLGMKSRFCVSEQLDHCWNIIEVNGVDYHVDVTWDDTFRQGWDLKGEVYHDYFLLSSAKSVALHGASDFERPSGDPYYDTYYDTYFWQRSYSAFCLVGDEIYYIDHRDEQIYRYSDHYALLSLDTQWGISDQNYACLDQYDRYLYFNSGRAIYEIDPQTEERVNLHEPILAGGTAICGFTVENGQLVYDVCRVVNQELVRVQQNKVAILPFTDIEENAWFSPGVRYVYRNGLMNGMSETVFAPEESMSRAMMVTVLYRLNGSPEVSGRNPFTDVSAGQWYSDAVLWAAQNGIVNGMTPTIFAPNEDVTRAQMVTILYRYADKQGLNTSATDDLSGFADRASAPVWAKDAVKWAVAEGIINGIPEGGKTYLRYDASTTRAQVATVLMRYLKK